MDAAWAQGGIGVAALAVLVYIVRELRAIHKETITFFGNHLSGTVEALGNLTASTERIVERLDRLENEMRREKR